MEEKRNAKRRKEDNEIIVTILSERGNPPKEKIIYNISKDISESGARIQTHSFLPVDTLLAMEVTLKNPPQIMSVLGKVRWIKSLFADEFYEAGVEFVNTSSQRI